MATVREKSVAYITVSFYDKTGSLATPATAFYQVHDKGSKTEMLPRTAFPSLGNTVELTMTSAINTLVEPRNKEETRVLTIESSGGGVDVNSEYEYDLLNLIYL